MARKTGPKLSLTKKKLKALFPAMMIAPQDKYIANALGVNKTQTIKMWVASGEALMDKYEELLEPLDDIFSFEYEAVFENRRLEYDAQFRMLYEIEPEDKIPDRLRIEYNNFMLNEKRKFIENNIERRENEIIDELEFVQDEDTNEDFKLYVKFARIYNRARNVKEIGYIQNIDKHAGTSKNVGLSLKMLSLMNKEDFAETQTIQHSGTIEVNNKSILAIAMQCEKEEREKKLLAEQKENIIDVTPVELLENNTQKNEQ